MKEPLICGHCLRDQRGYATMNGMPLCHPDEGMDCYHLVTVWGHDFRCEYCMSILAAENLQLADSGE